MPVKLYCDPSHKKLHNSCFSLKEDLTNSGQLLRKIRKQNKVLIWSAAHP